MGLARVPRYQTSGHGIASHCGPTGSQRPLPNKKDPEVFSSNSQAGRPLGQLRLEGQVLIPSPRLQRNVYGQHRRAVAAFLRDVDGLEPQPIRVSKTHGNLYGPPSRPRIGYSSYFGPLCYRPNAWTKSINVVGVDFDHGSPELGFSPSLTTSQCSTIATTRPYPSPPPSSPF